MQGFTDIYEITADFVSSCRRSWPGWSSRRGRWPLPPVPGTWGSQTCPAVARSSSRDQRWLPGQGGSQCLKERTACWTRWCRSWASRWTWWGWGRGTRRWRRLRQLEGDEPPARGTCVWFQVWQMSPSWTRTGNKRWNFISLSFNFFYIFFIYSLTIWAQDSF